MFRGEASGYVSAKAENFAEPEFLFLARSQRLVGNACRVLPVPMSYGHFGVLFLELEVPPGITNLRFVTRLSMF